VSFLDLAGGLRALRGAAAGILLAVACSVPAYDFVHEDAAHCQNAKPDADYGETDVDCGGTECHGCTYGQHCTLPSDCADGQCLVGFCQEPGCMNQVQDGEETGVDCGGSCPRCRDGQPCDAAADCESGVCSSDGRCATASCKDAVRNGDELDIDCGGSSCDGCAIGAPCAVAADCESGLCDAASKTCALNCTTGWGECDGDVSEPCETNLLTSTRNCGACGSKCELKHAESACVGGSCQIDTCVKPWILCNTEESDGCEVNASTDAMNCGGCGKVCPAVHGTPMCVSSTCAIECDDDWGDCDEDPLTGCEASIGDVENCGGCGKSCPSNEGTPFCLDGKCGATICDDGTGDCDGDTECETSLDDDPKNCGRCGHICAAANGTVDCVKGECVLSGCDDGWQNCDADAADHGFANGCESSPLNDAKNCGTCGQRCDLVANGSGTCQAGTCALQCDIGFADCDGRADTGCEANTTNDPAHCGGCKNACDIPHAKAACESSNCVVDDCTGSFDDCTPAEGCETDTSNNIQHCGSCAGTCSKAGATDATCTGGACDPPKCDGAHRSCDGNNANGCETDVTTAARCGSCNNACGSATPNCVLTGSTYACQAKITIGNAVPYPAQQLVNASSLTFNVTPHAGTNRMIVMVVASDSQGGNGITGARPDSVTFGGQAMLVGPSQTGADDEYSPDLFVYYFPLGDATSDGAQVQVNINAATAPAASMIIMQELQLNGVRQSAPITGSASGFVGDPDPDDPSTTTLTLPVATSGSAIYSFISTMWADPGGCTTGTPSSNCPMWSISPSANLTLTETLATASQILGSWNAPTRAFAMLVTATSPSLPAPGTYMPSWTIPNGGAGRLTHIAVAIAPAP